MGTPQLVALNEGYHAALLLGAGLALVTAILAVTQLRCQKVRMGHRQRRTTTTRWSAKAPSWSAGAPTWLLRLRAADRPTSYVRPAPEVDSGPRAWAILE